MQLLELFANLGPLSGVAISSTICKSDSLGLAKPQGEGCQDQSTSEDISASAGVPATKYQVYLD